MAEVIAAFSLAANVIQFLDFGSRFTSKLWSFYQAGRNSKESVLDIELITKDLRNITVGLAIPDNFNKANDEGLVRLAAGLVQSQKTLDQQTEVLRCISSVIERTNRLENSAKEADHVAPDREGIGNLLIKFLTSKVHTANDLADATQWRKTLVSTILNEERADRMLAAPEISKDRKERLESRFLENFWYSEMDDRQERISEAHEATFKWLLTDVDNMETGWSPLRKWLQSEDSNLYWVTGKAGSGKSTLMKYISGYQEAAIPETSPKELGPRCKQDLEIWANRNTPCQLLLVTFYFWNSGTHLQTSQLGLFRSLLHQIFRQVPRLISLTAPKIWETLCLFNIAKLDLSAAELQAMLKAVAQNLPDDLRLCLFVDGVDEFDGDHAALIRLLNNLLSNPNIKLCVASRPWLGFEDALQQQPHLKLELLTYDDIKAYITSHLQANEGYHLLERREPKYAEQLVESIVSKASGVFLWVRLVVSSLLAGMSHGDRLSDLQRRLDLLPPELENLYDKMLRSLDPFYLDHAAQLFQLVESSPDPMSLLLLSFVDEDDSQHAIARPTAAVTREEAMLRADTMKRRLNSRCKGLLEAGGTESNPTSKKSGIPDYTVQYLHRTVKDFVQTPDIQRRLQTAMKAPFDPYLKLCNGNLALLKSSKEPTPGTTSNQRFWRTVSCVLYSAARINPENADACIQLMDELYRTGTQLIKTALEVMDKYSAASWGGQQWACLHPECEFLGLNFGRHFLSLAVRYGVTEYVAFRAGPGCLIQRPNLLIKGENDALSSNALTSEYPLLLDALTSYPDLDNPLEWVPNRSMIACLLEKGAKFEPMVVGGHRVDPWLTLVQSTARSCAVAGPLEAWLEVAELATRRGYDASKWPMSIEKQLQLNVEKIKIMRYCEIKKVEILEQLMPVRSTPSASTKKKLSWWKQTRSRFSDSRDAT